MPMTAAQTKRFVEIAIAAPLARIAGHAYYAPAGWDYPDQFDLDEPGMCCAFVHHCGAAAVNVPYDEWAYKSGRATDTLAIIEGAGCPRVDLDELRPGDVVGHRSPPWGHIAIYVGSVEGHYGFGAHMVSENTSSKSRGTPLAAGTKLTPLGDMGTITQAYRIGVWAPGLKVVQEQPGQEWPTVLTDEGEIREDGRLWVPARATLARLGHGIEAGSDGKFYVTG